MQPVVYCSIEVAAKFPKLAVGVGQVTNVTIEAENKKIKELKSMVYAEVRAKYRDVEKLKDNTVVRAYRDLYWKLDIDPTKTRPSGEALLRRVLHGKPLPTISTAVDAYNLASMKTIIPISGFDMEKLSPPFNIRFAENGEEFIGIGMKESIKLTNKMLVLADTKRVLCIYPHRDSDSTKITEKTRNILIVGYGAQGISLQQLEEAVKTALEYIKKVCGGETQKIEIFTSTDQL